jgi:uncharacterized Fe-S cluster protein YjdI
MEKKIRTYTSEGVTVEYDAARCIHAKACVHGLPEVFDINARPWIQPDKAGVDRVAEVVRNCPTGALRYHRTDGSADEAPPSENVTRLVPDGPIYLAGDLRIALPDGEVLQETRVALCRCGASKNKPFCDGTHTEIGFTSG